jgi:predicted enzyme related to lactoylglutathione lyase
MIKYKEIAFTAYAVTSMRKARKFYEGVLGLKVSRVFSKNFIEYDIGPGTLVVACAPGKWKPSRHGTSAALEVKNFEEAVAHLRKKKVKFHIGPMDFPTCRMVAFRDPDGNVISLHQRKRQK